MHELHLLSQAVLEGKEDEARSLVQNLLAMNVTPSRILNEGLIKGMDIVGEKFRAGEYYLPEVLLASKVMHSAFDILKSRFVDAGIRTRGKVVMGTVKGDLHDIGKNIVIAMLEGAGFDVVDLGVDVDSRTFVESVQEIEPHVLGMSALLTTTMPYMKEVIEELEREGLRKRVKVIVGGAPVNERFAMEIGADGYAEDAGEAVQLVRKLLDVKVG